MINPCAPIKREIKFAIAYQCCAKSLNQSVHIGNLLPSSSSSTRAIPVSEDRGSEIVTGMKSKSNLRIP